MTESSADFSNLPEEIILSIANFLPWNTDRKKRNKVSVFITPYNMRRTKK